MADTILGAEGICSDCGAEGNGVTHWGAYCPTNVEGHFCPSCWSFRGWHYNDTGEAAQLGTNWLQKAAAAEMARREAEPPQKQRIRRVQQQVRDRVQRVEDRAYQARMALAQIDKALEKVKEALPGLDE